MSYQPLRSQPSQRKRKRKGYPPSLTQLGHVSAGIGTVSGNESWRLNRCGRAICSHLWSCSVSRCVVDAYGNGEQHCPLRAQLGGSSTDHFSCQKRELGAPASVRSSLRTVALPPTSLINSQEHASSPGHNSTFDDIFAVLKQSAVSHTTEHHLRTIQTALKTFRRSLTMAHRMYRPKVVIFRTIVAENQAHTLPGLGTEYNQFWVCSYGYTNNCRTADK